MDDDRIPSTEIYRDVGIHAGQKRKRVAVVRKAIDAVPRDIRPRRSGRHPVGRCDAAGSACVRREKDTGLLRGSRLKPHHAATRRRFAHRGRNGRRPQLKSLAEPDALRLAARTRRWTSPAGNPVTSLEAGRSGLARCDGRRGAGRQGTQPSRAQLFHAREPARATRSGTSFPDVMKNQPRSSSCGIP